MDEKWDKNFCPSCVKDVIEAAGRVENHLCARSPKVMGKHRHCVASMAPMAIIKFEYLLR